MKELNLKPLTVAVAMALGAGAAQADPWADEVASFSNVVNPSNALGAPDSNVAEVSGPGELVLNFTDNVCLYKDEGLDGVELIGDGTFPLISIGIEDFPGLTVGDDIFWFDQVGLTTASDDEDGDFELDAAGCSWSADILASASFGGEIGHRKAKGNSQGDQEQKVEFEGIAHAVYDSGDGGEGFFMGDGGEGYSVGTLKVNYPDGEMCHFFPSLAGYPGIGDPFFQSFIMEEYGFAFLGIWEYGCSDGGEGFADILVISRDMEGLDFAEDEFGVPVEDGYDINNIYSLLASLDVSGKGRKKWRGGICINSFLDFDEGEGDHRDVDGLDGACNADGGEGDGEGFTDAPSENTGYQQWGNNNLSGNFGPL